MGAALSGLGRAPAKLAVTVALALSALLVAYKLLLCPKLTIFVESDLAELQKTAAPAAAPQATGTAGSGPAKALAAAAAATIPMADKAAITIQFDPC